MARRRHGDVVIFIFDFEIVVMIAMTSAYFKV